MYILLSAKRRAYFCKSIAIEMGGVSRYFSKVSGSGADLTLPYFEDSTTTQKDKRKDMRLIKINHPRSTPPPLSRSSDSNLDSNKGLKGISWHNQPEVSRGKGCGTVVVNEKPSLHSASFGHDNIFLGKRQCEDLNCIVRKFSATAFGN